MYSYIYNHIDHNGCNSCTFTATSLEDKAQVQLEIHICSPGYIDVVATSEENEVVFQKNTLIYQMAVQTALLRTQGV